MIRKIYIIFCLLILLNYFFYVKASQTDIDPKTLYKTAFEIINEKFYFKSKVNLSKWENKIENKIKNSNDAYKYINKLVKSLHDPYTRFLTKEEFSDELNIINSSIVGIGVKLAINKPVVLDVLPDSPAHRGGIKPHDYIVAVNNKKTDDLNTTQVTGLMKGPKGTKIKVTLKRGEEVLSKILEREELRFNSISVQKLENNLALIKIDSFIPENTSQVFKEELLKLMSQDGIILDIRNNSGGLYKNAVEIADMFLSEGKIVSVINQTGKLNEYANSSKFFDRNIVILVNENTASASEILTSALKENNKAIVIGKNTFGKGLVQEIVKLPDESALHVTISAYLTPQGKYLDKTGIIPDEVIFDEKKQLERAKELLISSRNNKDSIQLASR